MSPFIGVVVLCIIILVAAGMAMPGGDGSSPQAAAPATGGRPVTDCMTRFYTVPGPGGLPRYCVKDGEREAKCKPLPLPAIVAANEMSNPTQCNKVVWGFGCEKGVLCGLQQSGPNLVSPATADKIAREQCGRPRARHLC